MKIEPHGQQGFLFLLEAVTIRVQGHESFPILWAAPCKNVPLGICRPGRPRSACASTQFDQGIHCPLTESSDTKNV